jgi:hypothetical protein
LRGVAEEATERSSHAIDALMRRAAEQVELSGATLRGALERSAETSVGAIAGASDRLRIAADEATQRSTDMIDALVKRAVEQAEQSGVTLRMSVERSAETSVEALTRTEERLRNELLVVTNDLAKTSVQIDQTVASADERLSAVQSSLSSMSEEFQHALGGIASQIAALGRLSATTQADAAALGAQLSGHAEGLAALAQNLEAQQHALDGALERRRDGLQTLVSDLSSRGEAFDAVLARFASTVEDSFNRAQARAHEVSVALASASTGASVSLAGQFESIRESAAKERERTKQSLQAAIDSTNAQLSGALDHAAERFRQSVAEVKEMASQVRCELDQTRQELRRGVLELPQETSETAEAMRRVVSDQIRALKELAALVSESGGAFDVAEEDPVAIAAPGSAALRYEQPLARAAQPVWRVEAEPSRVARPNEAIVTPVLAPPPPLPAPEPVADAEAATEPAPEPFRQPPSQASAKDQSEAGWLSHLLAAASRDEPEDAAAQRSYETLESLSKAIPGLVDNIAAAEMWDRWRRGDPAAVSRRLYTETGQLAFDEIRRRRRNDAQFREAVTRYVDEFERLLAKVRQNDRDGSQWRAYLLSNTGKVYTILAHASGRLG